MCVWRETVVKRVSVGQGDRDARQAEINRDREAERKRQTKREREVDR